MTSLGVLASHLRDTARKCWTASHGTNPPVMRKTLLETVTELDTIADHMHRARELGPDTDLELTLLASQMLQHDRQGDVRGAKDVWLAVWNRLNERDREDAA